MDDKIRNVAQPLSGSRRNVIAGVAIVIVIIAVLAVWYGLHISTPSPSTTSTSVSTSVYSTSTSISTSSTSTIPQFNFTQNVTINTLAINRSNALFGIPNPSQFETIFFNVTSGGDYISIYGLNFTIPVVGGSSETSVTYNTVIPAAYANAAYPVAIYTTITTYTKPTASEVYHHWFNNTYVNGTYYVVNNSRIVRNATGGNITEAVNITVYENLGIGNASIGLDFNPMYHLDQYEVAFLYNRDVVIVLSFGVPGHFNHAYVNNIAKHIYEVLLNG